MKYIITLTVSNDIAFFETDEVLFNKAVLDSQVLRVVLEAILGVSSDKADSYFEDVGVSSEIVTLWSDDGRYSVSAITTDAAYSAIENQE